MRCSICRIEIKKVSNNQKYCKKCAKEMKKFFDKERTRLKRRQKGKSMKALPDSCFPVNNEALLKEKYKFGLLCFIPQSCENCGNEEFDIDEFHGEIVCRKCGLVVETIYSNS